MRKLVVPFCFTAFLVSGCSTISDWWQHGEFSFGRKMEAQPGKPAARDKAAKEEAREVPQGKNLSASLPRGGADEALFRSALRSLNPSPDLPVSPRGRELLRRLKKEYPSSPWTALAAPLLELIRVADELSHRNQHLKSANESLNKEVSQLNQNIKQLKNLDLELEKSR